MKVAKMVMQRWMNGVTLDRIKNEWTQRETGEKEQVNKEVDGDFQGVMRAWLNKNMDGGYKGRCEEAYGVDEDKVRDREERRRRIEVVDPACMVKR